MLDKVDSSQHHRISNLHYYMSPENRPMELIQDGKTDTAVFGYLVKELKEVDMNPIAAKKESTGFVFKRVWAAI